MLKARSLSLWLAVAAFGGLLLVGMGERFDRDWTALGSDKGRVSGLRNPQIPTRLATEGVRPRPWRPNELAPWRRLEVPLAPPVMPEDPSAPVVDVGALAGSTPVLLGDLDPTIDVQITQEIIDKANELGTVEAMYEFVRNECTFQPYYGSQKGSVETLRQRAGNDYDLASLLIALLRASSIPARYAVGMVEIPVDRVTSWLSVDHGWVAGSILYTKGMESVIITSGDQVVAVRCRRVWVEAYVPRGFGGPGWVPLDPAFALTTVAEGLDVPEEMGLDAQAVVDEYWDPTDPGVTLPREETILELLEEKIQEYLDANHPGMTVDDATRRHQIVPENLGILPASLPYTVRSRDMTFSEIPANRRYQVRVHLHDGATNMIDHTMNLPEIAGKRITIDYVGATPADEATIDSYGGIYQTPPYLVDLRPVLRVDGQVVATGAVGLGMGYYHESDVYFMAPVNGQGLPQNVVPVIYNYIVCGASQALVLAVEGAAEALLVEPPADDTEGALQLNYDTGMDYLANVHNSDLRLGSIMHSFVTTDVTSAVLENVVNVGYDYYGVPQTFEWAGWRVDADRSIVGVWPVDQYPSGTEPRDFLIIGGADGSVWEHHVFETGFGQDTVSTIKILELAVDAGVTVYKRWSTLPLPPNTQPAYVQQALQNAIASGYVVTFPADPMTVGTPETGEWTGTGWIEADPGSGAAGYLISGTSNGGATYEYWPPEFIDLQEGDRTVVDVEIEITKPDNDSPDPDAVLRRHWKSAEHITFEYLVHVTYDDGSTATLGPYTRKTRNTTRTFSPGNYTFKVWIGRTIWWIWMTTLDEAERKISIVGVLIREDDGTDVGKNPPKFIPVKPAAPATVPFVNLMALVIPEKAPDGTTTLATAYSWSGGSKLSFTPANQRATKLEPSSPDPSGAVDDQEVTVTVDVPGGQVTGVAEFKYPSLFSWWPEDKLHKMTVFKTLLKEVSFSGTKYHAVREDNDSADYSAPHWQDNSSPRDGDATDSGDRRYPVAFTRNTIAKVTAKFTFEPAAALQGQPKIKGEGSSNVDIPETGAAITGSELSITNVSASSAFPNEVHFFNPFTIDFALLLKDETKWWTTGTSDNRVYVTLNDPAASKRFETLLDIGCRNAGAKTNAADAVAAVWTDFTGPIPGVKRKPIDGHNVSDYVEMKYWNPPTNPPQTVAGMLADAGGNGSCIAWSQLLSETCNAQGISGSTIYEVKANTLVNPGATSFLVKNWKFGKHVRTGPNGLRNTATAGDDLPLFGVGEGFADMPCIAAGPNGTLNTTPAGDDQISGTTITTGANGVCETTAAGDDVQVIPVGNGAPDQPCIMPGADGILNSTVQGDDTDQDGLFPGNRYPYVVGFDVVDLTGIPGQGNNDPPGGFLNHFIVRYGGAFYDPSYGAGTFAAQTDHENAAIDGIVAGQRAKKNDTGVAELSYTP